MSRLKIIGLVLLDLFAIIILFVIFASYRVINTPLIWRTNPSFSKFINITNSWVSYRRIKREWSNYGSSKR
jgi:hypothetical protein